jgi:hypothetical protein
VTTNFNAATFYRGTITITADVQPAAALTGATVTVSFGSAPVCTLSAAPFSCTVDTTTLSDGNNTATITATNPIGSASTTVVVKVDNTPPTLPPPPAQANGLAVLLLGDTINFEGITDATSGIAGVELLINDAVLASGLQPTSMANTYAVVVSSLPAEGTYADGAAVVRATDAAGNVTSVAIPFPVYVDAAPPTVDFPTPTDVSLNPTFTVSATDTGTGIQAVEFFLGTSTTALNTVGCPSRRNASQVDAPLTGPFTCTLVAGDGISNGVMNSLRVVVSDRSGSLTESRVKTTQASVNFTPNSQPSLSLDTSFDENQPRKKETVVIPLSADVRGVTGGTLQVTAPTGFTGATCVLAGASSSCTFNPATIQAFQDLSADVILAIGVRLTTSGGTADVTVNLNFDVTEPTVTSTFPFLSQPSQVPVSTAQRAPRFYFFASETLVGPSGGGGVSICPSDNDGNCGNGNQAPALQTALFSEGGTRNALVVYPQTPFAAPSAPQAYTLSFPGWTDVAGNALNARFVFVIQPEPADQNQPPITVEIADENGTLRPAVAAPRSPRNDGSGGTFVFNRSPAGAFSGQMRKIIVKVPVDIPVGPPAVGPITTPVCKLGPQNGNDWQRASCPVMVVQNNGTPADPSDDFVQIDISDVTPTNNPLFKNGRYFVTFEGEVPAPITNRPISGRFTLVVTQPAGAFIPEPPALDLTLPPPGALRTGDNIILGFQNDVDPTTLAAGIVLRHQGGAAVSTLNEVSLDFPVVIVSPREPLTPGAYELVVSSALRTLDNGQLATPTILNYTVSADTTVYTAEAIGLSPAPLALAPSGRLNAESLDFSYTFADPVLVGSVAPGAAVQLFEIVGTENVRIPVIGLQPDEETDLARRARRVTLRATNGGLIQSLRPDGRARLELSNVRRSDNSVWNLSTPVVADYIVAAETNRSMSPPVIDPNTVPSVGNVESSVIQDPSVKVVVNAFVGPRDFCWPSSTVTLYRDVSSVLTQVGSPVVLNNGNCHAVFTLSSEFTAGQINTYRVEVQRDSGPKAIAITRTFVPSVMPSIAALPDLAAVTGAFSGAVPLSATFDAGNENAFGVITLHETTYYSEQRHVFVERTSGSNFQGSVNNGAALQTNNFLAMNVQFAVLDDEGRGGFFMGISDSIFPALNAKAFNFGNDVDRARHYAFDETPGGSFSSSVVLQWPPGLEPSLEPSTFTFPFASNMQPFATPPTRVTTGCHAGGCITYDNSAPGSDTFLYEEFESLDATFTIDLWVKPDQATPGPTGITGPSGPRCEDLVQVVASSNSCRTTPVDGCVEPSTLVSLTVLGPNLENRAVEIIPLIDCGDNNGDQLVLIFNDASGQPLAFVFAGASGLSQNLFTLGQWSHVAASVDASGSSAVIRLSVNGTVYEGATLGGIDLNSNMSTADELTNAVGFDRPNAPGEVLRFYLGASREDSDPQPGIQGTPFGFFSGQFDELSLYGRPLSTQELQYNAAH